MTHCLNFESGSSPNPFKGTTEPLLFKVSLIVKGDGSFVAFTRETFVLFRRSGEGEGEIDFYLALFFRFGVITGDSVIDLL